jgi:hypothetical protein
MSHHLVERRKELKRRRKRRQASLKERDKKAVLLKTVPIVPRKIPKEPETVIPILTKPVVTPTTPARHPHETYLTEPVVIPITPVRNTCETDWEKAQSITELIKLLPAGIKTKKLWWNIPEQLKEEIITRARHMAASRNFAAPAEWDGSLKQALLLMGSGRLPNGFRIYLGL